MLRIRGGGLIFGGGAYFRGGGLIFGGGGAYYRDFTVFEWKMTKF